VTIITFQDIIDLIGDMNDIVVGNYFASRGLEPTKLDSGQDPNPLRNCDWLVQGKDTSFLCEVKTINSVQRGTETQANFRKKFENRVRDYFNRKKSVRNLPYHLHFHSDTLDIPEDKPFYRCLKLISQKIIDIHAKGEKQSLWIFENCFFRNVDLTMSWSLSGNLEIQVSSYGSLNRRPIEENVSSSIKQLERSGEDHPDIARMVVLAFASSVHITQNSEVVVFSDLLLRREKYLWRYIDSMLKHNSNLSAIAVMHGQTPPRFCVYHNPILAGIEPLDRGVFSDGESVQFDSLDAMPKTIIKPFDLHEYTTSILETIHSSNEKAITLDDYKALRTQKTPHS
jgi:hypothetical protein